MQVATDVVLEIQVPMGSELQGRGSVYRPTLTGRSWTKGSSQMTDGSSDPRRSTHGARGMLYM